MTVRLVSVQVGLPREYPAAEPSGKPWTSAYRKDSVAGPVRLGKLGLEGDGQADRRYHGGADMALLAYPHAHYSYWRAELSWPELPLGGFGENLTLDGLTEPEVCVGDIFALGEEVRVQVSCPRKPCKTISRYWKRPGLLRLVESTGRSGFYLRVLHAGAVEAGLPVRLLERPFPDWPVPRAQQVGRERRRDRASALALAACPALAESWRLALLEPPGLI